MSQTLTQQTITELRKIIREYVPEMQGEVMCDGCGKMVRGWVHKETFNYCFVCMDKRFGKCCHPESDRRISAFTGTPYCGLCAVIFAPISALTKEQELAAELERVKAEREQLANLAGEAIALGNIYPELGEKPVKQPDHALTQTMWNKQLEIARLRATVARMTEALKKIAYFAPEDDGEEWHPIRAYSKLKELARAERSG